MSKGTMAGRAFVELGLDDRMSKALKQAEANLKAFGGSVQKLGVTLAAIGGGVEAGLLGAAKAFADAGSAVYDMGKRTGLSAEAISELGYAAKQSGVEMGDLETGVKKMQKVIGEAELGSDGAQEALRNLGLTIGDLAGKSPEDQFELIAEKLALIADPTLKAAMAMQVFGKSGTALLPMMEGGKKGIAAMRAEARAFGLVMTGDMAKDADKLGDAFGLVEATIKSLVVNVGAALAPLLTDFALGAARVIATAIDWAKGNKDLIVTVFKVAAAVAAVGTALIGAGVAITAFGALLGGLTTIFAAIGSACGAIAGLAVAMVSPFGAIVALVVALAAAFVDWKAVGSAAMEYFGERFKALGEIADDTLGGIVSALKSGDIALAAKIALVGVKLAFLDATMGIRQLWSDMVTSIRSQMVDLVASIASIPGIGAAAAMARYSGPGGQAFAAAIDWMNLGGDPAGAANAMKQQFAGENVAQRKALNAELADLTSQLSGLKKQAEDQTVPPWDYGHDIGDKNFGLLRMESVAADPVMEAIAAISRISSSGTFSAAAAAGLAGTDAPMNRVAKATEETAKNTRKLANNPSGGLVFG